MKPRLSIILPVLNEGECLGVALQALQVLRLDCELIVVDGGSTDLSLAMAPPLADKVVSSPRGRAKQMNAGADAAKADIFLFLHADTALPDGSVDLITKVIEDGWNWGRFDVQFDAPQPIFKLIAWMMNLRSRLSGIATGDQAIFLTRKAFEAVGGFPDIALMEDITLSSRLKKLGKPCCLRAKVTTSARRWQRHGILKTIVLMWRLRLTYFFGADAAVLAARYYPKKHQ
ncbi:TIGR04283 family arsenosugar biosynthesis glycosyltransferase [Methylomonas rapida]|uniref:TIGR04283 family arsenosugar biosynthesis glycosyltransferase n=1 Tax=Methylomonas rapida TaxID=2963939 RepID=A0ABY7GPR5_9GAMM|nr:TIGR04283 family arsenosugar biosynthesis glycosyltransferase [Methylomonas rapida]WAR46502.1 TIGR04283 family arsenosugar biosynthesis glycosyltransferase [Methylomonas rapida]